MHMLVIYIGVPNLTGEDFLDLIRLGIEPTSPFMLSQRPALSLSDF